MRDAKAALFSFQPVVLWTDALIYLLLAVLVFFFFYALQREHLRAPWRQVRRRPLVMSALVVLFFYLAVGLADSFHFRRQLPATEANQDIQYSPEVLSFLDRLVESLKNNTERSYSAPLAAYAYTKETITAEDGTQGRDYPRLRFGGAHLKDPKTERVPDILAIASQGGMIGVALSGFGTTIFLLALARYHCKGLREMAGLIWRGESETAWKGILITSGLMIVLIATLMPLSEKYHLFGTDKVGQDVFYLTLKGIRTGLVIGALTTLVMLPFALSLGIAAGFFRGWIDDLIQYLYTTLSSVPGVLLIAAAVLILQVYMDKNADAFSSVTERADIRLLFLCIILGITGWIGLCRLLRGETLKLRELEYVQAVTALGVSKGAILVRHILPNVMHIVLISVVLDFSGLVLAEAVLAYVGVGVDPAMISWGNMINSARLELAREPVVWWSLSAAFLLMFGLVLSANVFSDGIRDAFDPRLRGR